jgi:CRISPR-associated protein Csh2
VDVNGTSIFGSDEEKSQGTFTTYHGLRYALIAFHGIANELNAKKSRMTERSAGPSGWRYHRCAAETVLM